MKREYKSPTFDAIVRLIEEHGPMTELELANELGRHVRTVGRSISEKLERSPGLMHVAEWERNTETGGKPSKLWATGPGADKAPPRALSQPEIRRRFYRKHKTLVLLKQRQVRAKKSSQPACATESTVAKWFDILKV